jgi:hypothetical protein
MSDGLALNAGVEIGDICDASRRCAGISAAAERRWTKLALLAAD